MEKILPPLIAFVATIVATIVVFIYEVGPLSNSIAVGTMTFGIVVAGFSATQRNMLLGMSGSSVLRFAVRNGFHDDILSYLMHCVYSGLTASCISIVGFFLDNHAFLWKAWLIIMTFAVVLIIGLIFRNEIMMVRIVKLFIEDQHQNTK